MPARDGTGPFGTGPRINRKCTTTPLRFQKFSAGHLGLAGVLFSSVNMIVRDALNPNGFIKTLYSTIRSAHNSISDKKDPINTHYTIIEHDKEDTQDDL